MTELAEFTHAVEDLLDEIRADKIVANSEIVDAILRSVDVIKAMLEERKAGSIYQEDVSELKESLRRLAQKDAPRPNPKLPHARGIVCAFFSRSRRPEWSLCICHRA